MAYPFRQINILDQIGGGAYGNEMADEFGFPEQMPRPVGRPPVSYPPIRNPQVPVVNSQTVDQPVVNDPTMASLMQQWYTPETEATDAFNQLLRNYPQREEPGFGRKLAASAAAWKGGPAAAEAFMYAPYLREKEDWMAQMQPRYQAANLERQSNINERTLAYNMATSSLNERKVAETERKNRELEKSRQQRNDILRFKAEHPNLQFKTDGPTIMILDPATGQITDSGVLTSVLSDYDAITLRGEYAIKAAEARAKVGGQVYQTDDGRTFRVRPDGIAEEVKVPQGTLTRPGTPARQTETEDRRARNNKIVDALDMNPAWKKWVTPPATQGGDFTIKERPVIGSWFKTDATDKAAQADYDAFMRAVKGEKWTPYSSSSTTSKPPSSQQSVPMTGGNHAVNQTPIGGAPTPARGTQYGQRQVVKKEYNPGRNQTRITYSDGKQEIVAGKQ